MVGQVFHPQILSFRFKISYLDNLTIPLDQHFRLDLNQ